MSPSLLQRAERLLAGGALISLAAAPLVSHASVLTTRDLVVENSGAYFYNASGFFADWRAGPTGGTVQTVNPDGSTKFYGSASASGAEFFAHNCIDDASSRYCQRVGERGVALVWSGTLAAPARVGDQLELRYDFSVDLPDFDGSWSLSAAIQPYYGFDNQVLLNDYVDGTLTRGTHHLEGLLRTQELGEWDIDEGGGPMYWQVVATAQADIGAEQFSEYYNSYYYTWGGVGLTVPASSIDVSVFNANPVSPVSEPGTLLMALTGVAGLLLRRRTR